MTAKEQVKRKMLEYASDGCKATELVTRLMYYYYENEQDSIDFFKKELDNLPYLIDELIKEKRLIEVQYVLPHNFTRVKSFLLPRGTKVTINESDGE